MLIYRKEIYYGDDRLKIKGKELGEIVKSLKTREGRRDFYRENREIILYIIFGAGTTLISMASYALFRVLFPSAESVPAWLGWIYELTRNLGADGNTILPNVLSWICANIFAFLTNRIIVFRSGKKGAFVLLEALKFFASRLFTLAVDILIMYLLVDLTGIHNFFYEAGAKVFSTLVVLVLNYILSKLFVFRKKKENKGNGSFDEDNRQESE